jgi:hypothetical protein
MEIMYQGYHVDTLLAFSVMPVSLFIPSLVQGMHQSLSDPSLIDHHAKALLGNRFLYSTSQSLIHS